MNIHIGKRGLVLLMFGGVFVVYGLALRDASPDRVIPVYHSIPQHLQGWLWVATGALAVVAALTTNREWVGFAALFPMPALWVLGYVLSVILHDTPPFGAIVWALVVGILLVISDWPEPPPKNPEGP